MRLSKPIGSIRVSKGLWILFILIIISGCSPFGGAASVQLNSSLYKGPYKRSPRTSFTKDWNFSASNLYTFNSAVIEFDTVSGSTVAKLSSSLSSDTFLDDSESLFDSGTFSTTAFDSGTNSVKLSSGTSGSFVSRVMDTGLDEEAFWQTLAWRTRLPNYKELPDLGTSETTSNYQDLADSTLMANVALLLHCNGSGAPSGSIVDSSGGSKHSTSFSTLSYVTGYFNNGIEFDATNDFIDIPAIDYSTTNKVSVSFWIKPSTSAAANVTENYLYELGPNYTLNSNAFAIYRLNGKIYASLKGDMGILQGLIALQPLQVPGTM